MGGARERVSPFLKGFGGSPPRKVLVYGCLYLRFNAFWMRFGTEFQPSLADLTDWNRRHLHTHNRTLT